MKTSAGLGNGVKASMRKEIIEAVTKGMKIIKDSAQRHEGSSLRRRTGTAARAIWYSIDKSSSQGISSTLSTGGGILNVWEAGRRSYLVRPRNKTRLKLPWGFRMSARIPASGPRSVLRPAVKRNLPKVEKFVSEAMIRSSVHILTRDRNV